jgi:putative FmdB family regulatory protein
VPTYQYVCTECGGQLEAVQKFSDDPLTVHDDCGGKLRKVFSPVGIVFKGSGFYRTDSRSGSGSTSSTTSTSSSTETTTTPTTPAPSTSSSAPSTSSSSSTEGSTAKKSSEKVA